MANKEPGGAADADDAPDDVTDVVAGGGVDLSSEAAAGASVLQEQVADAIRASLPSIGESTVRAIHREVPAYADALTGEMGRSIREAVRLALGGFLSLAAQQGAATAVPMAPVREGAYALGRGEARSGRSMDALLAAYRVGARIAWREMAATSVTNGVEAADLGRFAELVFAYIDDLSAASVAGHSDELANSGMVRERHLARLATALLDGSGDDRVEELARLAEWDPPRTLTAVLVGSAHVRTALGILAPGTLRSRDPRGADPEPDVATLLVPDVGGGAGRSALVSSLAGSRATVGPTRPWLRVVGSVDRAWRLRHALPSGQHAVQDTERHLVGLVTGSDPEALADLREQVLAPLDQESPASRERLEQTLAAWYAHRGRREEVAEALHVHPQTVRYRVGKLRELFGDAWEDADTVLALGVVVAAGLGEPPGGQAGSR